MVIGGASGAGKTKIVQWLTKFSGSIFSGVVTATTRRARIGERNGVHYSFLVPSQFMAKIADGLFIEHAVVHGNHYGTPRQKVEEIWRKGKIPVLNIDSNGPRSIIRYFTDDTNVLVISIFISPPSMKVLEQRLRQRCEGDGILEATILKRLANAVAEMEASNEYDHQVINDDLSAAVLEVLEIVQNIVRHETPT